MNPSDTALVSVHVSEYSALRGEINAFHAIEHQILNFNIAILAALMGFLAKGGVDWSKYGPAVALVSPIPFLLLGFFFGYSQIRIIQVAAYLNLELRPRVQGILQHDEVWKWEDFRKDSRFPNRGLSDFLGFLRWMLFVWPILFPLWVWFYGWEVQLPIGTMTFCAEKGLVIVEICLFFLLIAFAVFCSGRLRKNVTGR